MKINSERFKYIFFDADDTLWVNEEFFRDVEVQFAGLIPEFGDAKYVIDVFTQKQEENIPLFGYGSKTVMLGMLDAAVEICGQRFDSSIYMGIKKIITELAYHEVHLLDGVEEVLRKLGEKFVLGVVTKGDLTEQLYKFRVSGLAGLFRFVEVMQNKNADDYRAFATKLQISPSDILMVGNAIKSDIAPVIEVGGTAIYIPYRMSWQHEVAEMPVSDRLFQVKSIENLPDLLL